MKKTFTNFVAVLGLALILSGCASAPGDFAQAKSHPANPQAAESAQPPATPLLMAGAQGWLLPISTNQSTNQMEMKHEHPKETVVKDVQQPSEHKHEHEEGQRKEEKK